MWMLGLAHVPKNTRNFSAELPHVQNSSPLALDEAGVTRMIFLGGGKAFSLSPLCTAGTSCFASSGYARLFCTASEHAFLHSFSVLLWERVLAAANRASHRDKMSQPQEQPSVSTEGVGNVENQAARRTQNSHPSLMGLIKTGFYVPWMARNFLNLSDQKTEVVVLGGTAGTCHADVGSLAREAKQTLIKFGVKMNCELELTS